MDMGIQTGYGSLFKNNVPQRVTERLGPSTVENPSKTNNLCVPREPQADSKLIMEHNIINDRPKRGGS